MPVSVLGCLAWRVVPTTGQSDAEATAKVSDRPSERTDRPLVCKGDVLRKARTVQHLLRANGLDVKIDADYGPATAEAVKKFRATHDVTADDEVGKNTRPLPITTIDSRTTKSEAVEAMQYLLHNAGVPTGTTGGGAATLSVRVPRTPACRPSRRPRPLPRACRVSSPPRPGAERDRRFLVVRTFDVRSYVPVCPS